MGEQRLDRHDAIEISQGQLLHAEAQRRETAEEEAKHGCCCCTDGLDDIQRIIGTWNDATFGTDPGRSLALAYHLFEEAAELVYSLGGNRSELERVLFDLTVRVHLRQQDNEDADPADEIADVGVLLLALAHVEGLSLREEVLRKHEINKARTWNEPDSQTGVYRHKKGYGASAS